MVTRRQARSSIARLQAGLVFRYVLVALGDAEIVGEGSHRQLVFSVSGDYR